MSTYIAPAPVNLKKYVISKKINTFHYEIKSLVDDSEHTMQLTGKQAMNFLNAQLGDTVYVKHASNGEALHYRLVRKLMPPTTETCYQKQFC
jgi:hypothetical protein